MNMRFQLQHSVQYSSSAVLTQDGGCRLVQCNGVCETCTRFEQLSVPGLRRKLSNFAQSLRVTQIRQIRAWIKVRIRAGIRLRVTQVRQVRLRIRIRVRIRVRITRVEVKSAPVVGWTILTQQLSRGENGTHEREFHTDRIEQMREQNVIQRLR